VVGVALVVAIALVLLSSSWFYDSYLLWRDRVYTPRWAGDLVLSPFIYLAAGYSVRTPNPSFDSLYIDRCICACGRVGWNLGIFRR
jgi:hypothetical protein